ncbi:ABC transporter substrate-binding protein [Jiangella alba]|uniref:Peptide/nickel transport system substrate-binding protein n=1 Tax=Jiangella alba TaxID=561176 RepID=A0A1H5L5K2_9ACTN|nr:ABC transporter substrate-binding protein [Jiangella alba]SEE72250.1 peptide/nickel transport system substrate-binding protein [Jiangella alba]
MVRNRSVRISVLALCTTVAVAGCAGESSSGDSTGGSSGEYADGGSLTIAIDSDPGALDPQRSVNSVNLMMSVFAYDTPVKLLDSGEVAPSVVTSWSGEGTSYTLTVRDGVTCSDGSPMDAQTVADNINYVADAANASPMLGVAVPAAATATGDNAAGTVEVTLESGAPFFLQNLAELPLVCAPGLQDRDSMTAASAGSGPFVLSKALPGNEYEYTLRDGYAWGLDGASTDEPGLPETITFRVVESATTTANLMLSGEVNLAQLGGTDMQRLEAGGLFSDGGVIVADELTFNQAPGEPTADVEVRRALVAALDMDELAQVSTGGLGERANGLLTDPKICSGDTVTPNLPAYDPEAAATMLDDAGWEVGDDGLRGKDGAPLSVLFVYDNEDPETAATAEYIGQKWGELGVEVTLNGQSFTERSDVVFGGKGPWTATLINLGVSNPATLMPFFSGPTPADGINYGSMSNDVYESSIGAAQSKAGTDGCDDWNAGEGALIKDADITPISVVPYLYWGNGVEFDVVARILEPTSLRVLA